MLQPQLCNAVAVEDTMHALIRQTLGLDILRNSSSCMAQVEAYLEAFAAAFDLEKHIRFNTPVLRVTPCKDDCRPSTSANSSVDAGQNGHSYGESATGSADSDVANGVSQNGLQDGGNAGRPEEEEKLPWPRWRVTTAPDQDQVHLPSATEENIANFGNQYRTCGLVAKKFTP